MSRAAPRRLAQRYDLWRTFELEVDGRPAEQWVYSDGLHALSVFRTSGAMRPPSTFELTVSGGTRLWRGPGPGTWAWEGDGYSWVVVAEEPRLDPHDLLAPFPKGGPSLGSRMGSVWARIVGPVAGLFD